MFFSPSSFFDAGNDLNDDDDDVIVIIWFAYRREGEDPLNSDAQRIWSARVRSEGKVDVRRCDVRRRRTCDVGKGQQEDVRRRHEDID